MVEKLWKALKAVSQMGIDPRADSMVSEGGLNAPSQRHHDPKSVESLFVNPF